MIDMIPEMCSLKDASKRTGLSYNYLRHLCIDDSIPHIRIGSGRNAHIKVNLTALCKFLNGNGRSSDE